MRSIAPADLSFQLSAISCQQTIWEFIISLDHVGKHSGGHARAKQGSCRKLFKLMYFLCYIDLLRPGSAGETLALPGAEHKDHRNISKLA
jgi:hypothetical protein